MFTWVLWACMPSVHYGAVLMHACMLLQGQRHSIAYFANVHATTVLQGPQAKYPPITFPAILAAKQKKQADRKPREEMTDADKLERWKEAHGVEFGLNDKCNAQPAIASHVTSTSAEAELSQADHGSVVHPPADHPLFDIDCASSKFCSEDHAMQGDRHSIAYFANARGSTLLQGPKKKYPPITFPEILAEKQRQTADVDFEKMNDEQKVEFLQTKALGPEMEFLVEDHMDANGDPIITPMPKGALPDAMKNLAMPSNAAAAR